MTETDNERVYFYPENEIREKITCRFNQVKRELETLVPGSDIQHVGSTAIPDTLTKGDLDIQVRVKASQYSQAKKQLVKVYSVNDGGFVAHDATSFEDHNDEPTVGIHLTVIGGSCDIQWKFRDILLKSDSLQKEYDNFKRKFEGCSMKKYRDAKADFVERVLLAESIIEF